MDFAFEALIDFIFGLLGPVLNFFTKGFFAFFNLDTTQFFNIFAPLRDVTGAFKVAGISLVSIIVVLRLFRNFAAPVSDDYEDPVKLIGRALFSYIAIANTYFVMNLEFSLVKTIYKSVTKIFNNATYKSVTNMTSLDWKKLGEAVVSTETSDKIVINVVCIIFIFITFKNFFRTLLEAAERYVVISTGVFCSPLACSSLASKGTSKIFHSYIRLIFNELLLMIFNVIFIRSSIYAINTFIDGGGGQVLNAKGDTVGNVCTFFFLLNAFLIVGQKMDAFMRSLGMDIAQTGGRMMDEISMTARGGLMSARMAAASIGRGHHGGLFGGGRSGGGAGTTAPTANGRSGLANKISGMTDKLNGMTYNSMGKRAAKGGTALSPDALQHFMKNGASGELANVVASQVLRNAGIGGAVQNVAWDAAKGKYAVTMQNGARADLSHGMPVGCSLNQKGQLVNSRGQVVGTAVGDNFLVNSGAMPLSAMGSTATGGIASSGAISEIVSKDTAAKLGISDFDNAYVQQLSDGSYLVGNEQLRMNDNGMIENPEAIAGRLTMSGANGGMDGVTNEVGDVLDYKPSLAAEHGEEIAGLTDNKYAYAKYGENYFDVDEMDKSFREYADDNNIRVGSTDEIIGVDFNDADGNMVATATYSGGRTISMPVDENDSYIYSKSDVSEDVNTFDNITDILDPKEYTKVTGETAIDIFPVEGSNDVFGIRNETNSVIYFGDSSCYAGDEEYGLFHTKKYGDMVLSRSSDLTRLY